MSIRTLFVAAALAAVTLTVSLASSAATGSDKAPQREEASQSKAVATFAGCANGLGVAHALQLATVAAVNNGIAAGYPNCAAPTPYAVHDWGNGIVSACVSVACSN